MSRSFAPFVCSLGLVFAACGGDDGGSAVDAAPGSDGAAGDAAGALAQTVYVAHEGSLSSYDLATGEERPGAITNVTGPVDLQALASGKLLVNLTGRNEILIFDGTTMLEDARLSSSAGTATRPVHSYLTPERAGHQYWITMNDGADGEAPTNSARFIDVMPGSATYLQAVGEVPLGIGHHKAAFSTTRDRVVISNIADCDSVMAVYDYSDIANIQVVATLTAEQAGWDGSSFPRTCDPTYTTGLPPAPHGCATSTASGKAYCNVTTSGEVFVVDLDAATPTFTPIATQGAGGGYTRMHPAGRHIYTLGETPREGDGGATCQVGILTTIDAQTDTVVDTLPLGYTGPGCTQVLTGTDEETANPGHLQIAGNRMLIALGGGFMVGDARTRQEVVIDLTDPANPVQEASLAIGATTSHRGDTLAGDGRSYITANTIDGTLSVIDMTTLDVRTITTSAMPLTVATFGSAEGPSHQTGPHD